MVRMSSGRLVGVKNTGTCSVAVSVGRLVAVIVSVGVQVWVGVTETVTVAVIVVVVVGVGVLVIVGVIVCVDLGVFDAPFSVSIEVTDGSIVRVSVVINGVSPKPSDDGEKFQAKNPRQ